MRSINILVQWAKEKSDVRKHNKLNCSLPKFCLKKHEFINLCDFQRLQ